MTTHTPTDQDRRAFWQKRMDAAFDFMTSIMDQPVQDCAEPLADIKAAADRAHVQIAFSNTKIDNTFDRIFFIRQGLIAPLIAVARDMNARGWTLKIEDAYRTVEIQSRLTRTPIVFETVLKRVLWELNGRPLDQDLLFKRLTALVATCPKIGTHTSSSALDISVLNSNDRTEVNRGAPYLELSELTPMDSPFVSPQAQANRQAITAIFARHGFVAYPFEFWHYNSGDAYDHFLNNRPGPARYAPVNCPPPYSAVSPIADPKAPLISPDQLHQAITAALARIKQA